MAMIQDMERCKQDGDYFRAELGTDPGFLITFDLITEESAAEGDTADGGYSGSESCAVDEFDDEGVTAIDKAVRFLTRECSVEAGSSHFHSDLYYSDADGDTDWRTGDETRKSYHPVNFTVDEQRVIFERVRGSRRG